MGQNDGGQGCEHHAPSVLDAQPGTQGRSHQETRVLDQRDSAEKALNVGALAQIMEAGTADDQARPGGQSLEHSQAPERSNLPAYLRDIGLAAALLSR